MAWEMNKDEARVWLRQVVEVIRKGCTLTTTTIDESVCDMLLNAIDSDLIYGWMWSVLDGILGDTDIVPMMSDPVMAAECEAKGINPLIIISVLKALYDLWKLFRPK